MPEAKKHNLFLTLIVILSGFLLFWEIGIQDVSEWDEARNGVIAYNMYHNGDYINFYYGGEIDTWQVKPPLLIWLIVLSYKIFGFCEFALRLPSVLSSLFFFVIFFKFVALYTNSTKAFITGLILMSCNAIIGWHVGRTADFDALLLLMLTCSAYYFMLYLQHKKNYAIYLTALFIGLAFYTKATAAFLLLPGFFLFIIASKNFKRVFRNKHTYWAILLGIAIISSWIILSLTFGVEYENSFYGSSNAIETLFFHDTYKRLTDSQFPVEHTSNPFNFFLNLDTEMNVWNYFFYLSILVGTLTLFKKRKPLFSFIRDYADSFLMLAICLTLPIILVFSLSVNINGWYFAPIWGFVAFFIAECIYTVHKQFKYTYVLFFLVFVFTYVRHFNLINSKSNELHYALAKTNKHIATAEQAVLITPLKQDLILYLHWLQLPYIQTKDINTNKANTLVIIDKANLNDILLEKITPIQYTDAYCIGYIQ